MPIDVVVCLDVKTFMETFLCMKRKPKLRRLQVKSKQEGNEALNRSPEKQTKGQIQYLYKPNSLQWIFKPLLQKCYVLIYLSVFMVNLASKPVTSLMNSSHIKDRNAN